MQKFLEMGIEWSRDMHGGVPTNSKTHRQNTTSRDHQIRVAGVQQGSWCTALVIAPFGRAAPMGETTA